MTARPSRYMAVLWKRNCDPQPDQFASWGIARGERGWGRWKTMPWHQNTSLHKNYTKTSCWLGSLVGILFYAKEITVLVIYWFYPLQKWVSPLMLQRSTLACNVSSVFICQELKTVHTRRLPNKKWKYPKSAKPPHHVSEANITVVHEHRNRNKQNWNTNKHSTTRVPTTGTKMKGGTHEKSQERKRTEKKMHHLHVQRITAGVKLTFVRSTVYCIQLHCNTLHTTLLHCHTHLTQVSFLYMCMFLCSVFVYMSRCFYVFLHVRVLFCRGVWQICAFFQIESLYIAPVFCLKGNPHLQADRSLFRESPH